MTVRLLADGSIELRDSCAADDAEPLLQHLLGAPDARVDWRSCVEAHAAVIQVLLVARPKLHGPPSGDYLRIHIAPLLSPRDGRTWLGEPAGNIGNP